MNHNVDAIFDHGVFRPLQPVSFPEGTKVHLSFSQAAESDVDTSRLMSPRLANTAQTTDFALEVEI
jgi:predicted DNA-binding antitoxin AbrB/MazE fold protein